MENEKFHGLVLEHLAKLNQEITEIKTDVSGLKTDVSGLKEDMGQVKGAVVRIENDHGDKLKALFGAREVLMDRTERLMESQNRMEVKIDRLSLRMSANEAELRKAK